MALGDHAEAWRIDAQVLAARDPATRDDPRLPYHHRWVWDGRPYEGRHVLVRCYHGLGDTIQFARYLRPLRMRTASVTLEVQPRLTPILSSVPGIDRFIPFSPESPAPPSECDIEITELPFALKLAPDALRPPYLRGTPGAPPKGSVGLCWQAGDWDPERSVASDLFAPLTRRPCLTLQTWPTLLRVDNPKGCPRNIIATTSLIDGLDLVITVDTMVAHLAGALNRPTWLLLKHSADWRWMAERSDSPWYPSMRLYRQSAPGDWRGVMARVAEDFAALV